MHFIERLDLLLTTSVALHKLIVLSLEDAIVRLGLIVVLFEQIYQLVLRLVFAKLHFFPPFPLSLI